MQSIRNSTSPNFNGQAHFRATNNFSPEHRGTLNPQSIITEVRPVTSVGDNNITNFQNNIIGSRVITGQITSQPRVINNSIRGTQIINPPLRQITQIAPPRQTFVQPQQLVINRPSQVINTQRISRPSIAFSQIMRQNQPQIFIKQQAIPQTVVQPRIADSFLRPSRVVESVIRPAEQKIYYPPTQSVTISRPQQSFTNPTVQLHNQLQPEVERRVSYVRQQDPMIQTRHSNWQSYYQNKKPLESRPITTLTTKEKTSCSPWYFLPLALLALGGLIAGIVLANKKGGQTAASGLIDTSPGVPITPVPQVNFTNYTITVQTTVLDLSTKNQTISNTNTSTNTNVVITNTSNATTQIIALDPITVPATVTTIINNATAINSFPSTNTTVTTTETINTSTNITPNTNNNLVFNSSASSSTPVYVAPTTQQVQIPPQYVEPIVFEAWESTPQSISTSDTITLKTEPTVYAIDQSQQKEPMIVDPSTSVKNTIAPVDTAPVYSYQVPSQTNSFSSSSLTQKQVQPMIVSTNKTTQIPQEAQQLQ